MLAKGEAQSRKSKVKVAERKCKVQREKCKVVVARERKSKVKSLKFGVIDYRKVNNL